ncbi:17784_t:CDS:2, partial [Cetraspora pellucida]
MSFECWRDFNCRDFECLLNVDIEEFLFDASFVSEEEKINSDFSQESNDIAESDELPESDEELQLLRRADETNELLESDAEFSESEDVFEEEVHELAGAWEVDPHAVKEAGEDLSMLCICNHHLNYDNSLHPCSPESGKKINVSASLTTPIISASATSTAPTVSASAPSTASSQPDLEQIDAPMED